MNNFKTVTIGGRPVEELSRLELLSWSADIDLTDNQRNAATLMLIHRLADNLMDIDQAVYIMKIVDKSVEIPQAF